MAGRAATLAPDLFFDMPRWLDNRYSPDASTRLAGERQVGGHDHNTIKAKLASWS